jgi:hypothetical protein
VIERVTSRAMPPQGGDARFVIAPSHRGLERHAFPTQ